MKTNILKKFTVVAFGLAISLSALASDHFDGPVTMEHGVADISDLYAFPTPENSASLSLVLNVYPVVSKDGHFSEKVNYVFILKTAEADRALKQITTHEEARITCSFITPHQKNKYSVTCQTDKGLSATANIDKLNSKGDFRLFAGMASDPFFFNADWVKSTMNDGKISKPKKDNIMDKLNVLSVVIDIELNKIFENYKDGLIAVAAQSLTKDTRSSNWRQLDWVGRPEVTNFSLVANGKTDLRDKYNEEVPFNSPFKYEEQYVKRLYENITSHYDSQDKVTDWKNDDAEALVSILLDDFLVVNPHLPCNEDNYFEIERSILKESEIKTCGGRKLTDDIVDKVLSLYITSNPNILSDGVDKPYRKIYNTFPYLSKPDTSASARFKAWIARKFGK